MSIEGMWCFLSGDVVDNSMSSGGIVVLDTGRIYGGDSVMAFIGRYEVSGGVVEGKLESFKYNPTREGVDVFGEVAGPIRMTEFKGSLNDKGFLAGNLMRDGVQLPIVLQKLRDLP